MGMYDYVHYKQPMPDGRKFDYFQTKNFERSLDHYYIMDDGQLMVENFDCDDQPLGLKNVEYDGDLMVSAFDEKAIFRAYKMCFVRGKLQDIELVNERTIWTK